jgi:hypothetical protein
MCEKEPTLYRASARAVPRYLSQRVAAADSPIRDGLKKIRIESAAHTRQNSGEK